MAGLARAVQGVGMADNRHIPSRAALRTDSTSVVQAGLRLTEADFNELVRELDDLRRKHRIDLERRLRDARDFGSPADNDDVLAVLEEVAVDASRIAQLDELVRSAFVIDDHAAFDGCAGLGCVVRVVDDRGRTSDHRLVGRRGPDAGPRDLSVASPVGKALLAASPGDAIEVMLPSGRARRLDVVAVTPPTANPTSTMLHDAVEAA
jgi:transcription elongation factor GreA